jgi:methylaspartate ammonia-lyase
VWTGTTTTGAYSGGTCNGWTDGSATPTADVGLTSDTGSGWTTKYLLYCNRTNLHLYCFEQ